MAGKDETLFCASSCQKWLHRYCASVSAQRYQFLAENNTPFICLNCRCERQEEHISELKNTVALLKTEITELRESIMNLRMTTQDAPANLPNMSYAAAAAGSGHRRHRRQGSANSNRRATEPSRAKAATLSSVSGESAPTHTHKVKVTGARRIWGTLQECSVRSVRNTLTRLCGIGNSVRVKRKTKVNPSTHRS